MITFKQDRPVHRLLLGFLAIIIGANLIAINIFLAESMSFFLFLVGVSALCFGIYIMVTHRAYSERYGSVPAFSTPVAPDGSDLVPDVQTWQKQQAGDLTTDSPLEVRLKVISAIAGIIGLAVACVVDGTLKYLIGVLIIVELLSFYLRKISRRARWWADKINVYSGIFLICLTPAIIYILWHNNASLTDLIITPILLLLLAGFLIRETIVVNRKLKLKDSSNYENER